ncbi:UNVERIFIED_CONTAM: hypothetical protein FKN15_020465 [Acipenser sinensis]
MLLMKQMSQGQALRILNMHAQAVLSKDMRSSKQLSPVVCNVVIKRCSVLTGSYCYSNGFETA